MEGLADITTDLMHDIDENRPAEEEDEEDGPGLRFTGPTFAQFCISQRPILLAQRPDVRGTVIARVLGAQWRHMSADEKAVWTLPPAPARAPSYPKPCRRRHR
jgi:hypothetical protein